MEVTNYLLSGMILQAPPKQPYKVTILATWNPSNAHMSQGLNSTRCIGDGKPPTFNDGNPYNGAL